MPDSRRVYRRVTTSAGGAAARVSRGIAPEVLRDASNRLGVVGLVYAGGFLAGIVTNQVFRQLGWTSGPMHATHALFDYAGLLVGLAVFAIARRAPLQPAQFIAVGIVFEILGGLIIVYPEQAMLLLGHAGAGATLSWLAVWIAIFAPLLPTRPSVTVATGLVAASMSPLSYAFLTLVRGHPAAPASALAMNWIPNYVVALLATIPAIGIYRMRCAMTEARELGSYRLEEPLGKGGMGEVWRASHRLLARPAAIKLIGSEQLAHATGVEVRELIRRFELEAQSTASLSSPHTVALYDFGVTDDGTLYYVMELLQGLDLDRLVERFGPLPPARVVRTLQQICESLDEAHGRGLVHRDIKPANVHVGRVGRQYDFVKLLDFGLVKRQYGADPGDTRLTIGIEARGTPAFMPPEMAGGGTIDGRTDLYSVGCLAYWLLTGQMVFEGRTLYEVISHHLNTPPVPPSRRTELPVPAALEAIVLDCLAKDPAARPASARVLARRLADLAFDPPWTGEQAEAWWRTHLPEFVARDGAGTPDAAVRT